MKPAEVKLPQPNISGIKNKQRRGEAFRQLKREKTKVKLCNLIDMCFTVMFEKAWNSCGR